MAVSAYSSSGLVMPRFQIETAYPDGYTCERHFIEALTREEACELAVMRSGDPDEAWTVVEPGETFIESVVQLLDSSEIPLDVPEQFCVEHRLRHAFQHRWQLYDALTLLFLETNTFCSSETAAIVRSVLATRPSPLT